MSYIDLGFNENLVREDTISTQQELDPLQFESFAPELSASKLTGLMQSQDGKVKIDLDENSISISNDVEEIVRLGKLKDGSYGMVVKNKEGNELVKFGEINLMQSPSTNLQLDFDAERILVKDGGIPRVLIGKDEGGF